MGMAGTFKFELVTPERMLLSEDAAQVVVPGNISVPRRVATRAIMSAVAKCR